MLKSFEKLFSPIQYGNITLKNRMVMAPMAVHMSTQPSGFGFVNDREIAMFERRAQGGVGLIIVGSLLIKTDGDFGYQIYIDNDNKIPGLKKLVDAVHRHGTKIAAQIHHAGRATNPKITGYPTVSASALPATPEYPVPRELTTCEVKDYVEYYAQAARRAKEAGFDAVEFHGAHGYLIAQFMSPLTNFRTDQYGGSFLGRMRFITEIFKRTRELVGEDYTLSIRMSGDEIIPGGIDMHLAREIAQYLEKLGAAAINVSVHTYPYYRIVPPMYYQPGVNVYLAENIKEVVKIPVMTVGRINTPELAEEILSAGKADLVCLGRVLLADPDFPRKAEEGRAEEIIPCIACNKGCHNRKAEDRAVKCTMNPETGRETSFKINPAEKTKKVMIVGGGPAGMEAARVATLRGHEVELYEKNETLGGRLVLASVPPYKAGYMEGVEYLKRTIKKLDIKVHTGVNVDKAFIMQKKPDVVIIATGAQPLIPGIPGMDKAKVMTSDDLLAGKCSAGKRVVVIGGGSVGAETAHYLMDTTQREVFLIEMLSDIALDMSTEVRVIFMKDIKNYTKLHILTDTKVIGLEKDAVVVEKNKEAQRLEGIETVILAVGAASNQQLGNEVNSLIDEVYTIGDARTPDDATEAIYEGSKAAREI